MEQTAHSATGTGPRWWQQVLGSLAPPKAAAIAAPAASLVNAQFWLEHTPWRPAAFWAVGAGLLASGLPLAESRFDGKTVVLLILLADVLWGALWRMAGGQAALLALPAATAGQPTWLPYLQPKSPAARLFSAEEPDVWSYALRAGGPVLLLALLVSATLGSGALLLTGATLVTAATGWTVRRSFGFLPALLASLVTVALPWALVLQAADQGWSTWQWLAQLTLLALWMLHQWGTERLLAHNHDWVGMGLAAAAQVGLCGLLVVSQAPLWLALIVLLLLPTWLAIIRQEPLQRQRVLWLAAMLVSALALGQAI